MDNGNVRGGKPRRRASKLGPMRGKGSVYARVTPRQAQRPTRSMHLDLHCTARKDKGFSVAQRLQQQSEAREREMKLDGRDVDVMTVRMNYNEKIFPVFFAFLWDYVKNVEEFRSVSRLHDCTGIKFKWETTIDHLDANNICQALAERSADLQRLAATGHALPYSASVSLLIPPTGTHHSTMQFLGGASTAGNNQPALGPNGISFSIHAARSQNSHRSAGLRISQRIPQKNNLAHDNNNTSFTQPLSPKTKLKAKTKGNIRNLSQLSSSAFRKNTLGLNDTMSTIAPVGPPTPVNNNANSVAPNVSGAAVSSNPAYLLNKPNLNSSKLTFASARSVSKDGMRGRGRGGFFKRLSSTTEHLMKSLYIFRRQEAPRMDLKALSFADCRLTRSAFSVLAQEFISIKTLIYVDLRNCHLDDEAVEVLWEVINRTTIRDLCLAGNAITSRAIAGVDGVSYLAKPLKLNNCLEAIDFSENQLDHEAVEALCGAFKLGARLQFLNLSFNSIGNKGGYFIADLLRSRSCLEVLVLNDCGLTDDSGIEIARELRGNYNLKRLYLKGNKLTNDTAAEFIRSLVLFRQTKGRIHPTPAGGSTSRNMVSFEALKQPKSEIKHQLQSRFMSFEMNASAVFLKEEEDINEDINNKLTILDLKNNQISPEMLKEVKDTMKRQDRFVFDKESAFGVHWSEDAWVLAQSNDGAAFIASAVDTLRHLKDKREHFQQYVVTAEKKNGRTMMEILILASTKYVENREIRERERKRQSQKSHRSSRSVDRSRNEKFDMYGAFNNEPHPPSPTNSPVRDSKPIVAQVQNKKNTARKIKYPAGAKLSRPTFAPPVKSSLNSKISPVGDSSELDSLDSEQHIQGFLDAIKELKRVGRMNLDDTDSTGRKYLEVLKHHPHKAIRDWARSLDTLDGRYCIEEGAPVHASDTCIVWFAQDLETSDLVALKFVDNDDLFDHEVSAREDLRRDLSVDKFKEFSRYIVDLIDVRRSGTGHRLRVLSGSQTEPDVLVAPNEANEAKVLMRSESDPEVNSRLMLNTSGEDNNRKPGRRTPNYLVLPRMERSLFDVMHTEKLAGIDLESIRKIALDAAKALNFVNSRNRIHGDFKPRNFVRSDFQAKEWKLIDFDSCVLHGRPIGIKHSTAYSPPEVVRSLFHIDPRIRACPVHASCAMDVWSFGVVLYELLSGTPLFVCNKLDDNLFTTKTKVELMNWLEISEEKLARISNFDQMTINAGRDLVRKCLQANPANRIEFDEMLDHQFFKTSLASFNLSVEPLKTHFFLSHVQVEAAGTVKDLFYVSQQLGCTSWLDMEAGDLTVQGMQDGVKYAEHFIQILTERTFKSPFVVLELLWAVDLNKKIVYIIEEEDRPGFCPFKYEVFLRDWSDEANLRNLARNILNIADIVFEEYLSDVVKGKRKMYEEEENAGIARCTQEMAPLDEDELVELLSNDIKSFLVNKLQPEKIIPYRRRNYETNAMMEQIMSSIDFVTPSNVQDELRDSKYDDTFMKQIESFKDLKFYVLALDDDCAREMYENIKSGLKCLLPFDNYANQWKRIDCRQEFTPDRDTNRDADRFDVFLVLLTPGFFSTGYAKIIKCWEEYWKQNQMIPAPLVAVQQNWFKQPQAVQQAETNGITFESIFSHTEVMTYRAPAPRQYEHNAMLKEISRRLIKEARKIKKKASSWR